jgi:hypothetical protein
VLLNLTADDQEASGRATALAQGLQQLGWTVGRNVQIDHRWRGRFGRARGGRGLNEPASRRLTSSAMVARPVGPVTPPF